MGGIWAYKHKHNQSGQRDDGEGHIRIGMMLTCNIPNAVVPYGAGEVGLSFLGLRVTCTLSRIPIRPLIFKDPATHTPLVLRYLYLCMYPGQVHFWNPPRPRARTRKALVLVGPGARGPVPVFISDQKSVPSGRQQSYRTTKS